MTAGGGGGCLHGDGDGGVLTCDDGLCRTGFFHNGDPGGSVYV